MFKFSEKAAAASQSPEIKEKGGEEGPKAGQE